MPIMIDCVCENCNKPFQRERYKYNWTLANNRRFMCSRACVVAGNLGEGNGNAHPKGPRWQSVKNSLVSQRGSKCQCCGWSRDTLDACHVVDRADGGLDTLDNLLLLCPNHHRLFDANLLSREEIVQIETDMARFGYNIKLQQS